MSRVLDHEESRELLLRRWPSVIAEFVLGPGVHLRAVGAVDGDTGLGTEFSDTAHDVDEMGVGGRLERGLLGGGLELVV